MVCPSATKQEEGEAEGESLGNLLSHQAPHQDVHKRTEGIIRNTLSKDGIAHPFQELASKEAFGYDLCSASLVWSAAAGIAGSRFREDAAMRYISVHRFKPWLPGL